MAGVLTWPATAASRTRALTQSVCRDARPPNNGLSSLRKLCSVNNNQTTARLTTHKTLHDKFYSATTQKHQYDRKRSMNKSTARVQSEVPNSLLKLQHNINIGQLIWQNNKFHGRICSAFVQPYTQYKSHPINKNYKMASFLLIFKIWKIWDTWQRSYRVACCL